MWKSRLKPVKRPVEFSPFCNSLSSRLLWGFKLKDNSSQRLHLIARLKDRSNGVDPRAPLSCRSPSKTQGRGTNYSLQIAGDKTAGAEQEQHGQTISGAAVKACTCVT